MKKYISLGLVCAFWCSHVFPTNKTWSGLAPNNQNWTANLNWLPVGAPNNGDAINFDGNTRPSPTVNMNFSSFIPSSMTFENGVTCQLTGTGIFTAGATASCPQLFFNGDSTGAWQNNTTINLDGDLELSGTGGAAQFAAITGSGNFTIDPGITCLLTGRNTAWTASTITIGGTLNTDATNSLPVNASLVLENSTNAEWVLSNISQSLLTMTGGTGAIVNLSGALLQSDLTLTSASGAYDGQLDGNGFLTLNIPSQYTFNGTNHGYIGTINLTGAGSLVSGTNGGLPRAFYNLSNTSILDLNGTNCTVRFIAGDGQIHLSSASNGGYLLILPLSNDSPKTYSGVISDIGGPRGSIELGNRTLTLTGINTYRGGTVISGGTLRVSQLANLGDPAALVHFLQINGSNNAPTFQPTSFFDFAPSPSLGIFIRFEATIDTSIAPLQISTSIDGSGTLAKKGGNPLTLTHPTSYTSGTKIYQGTLALSGAGALPPIGTVNIMEGATFDISQLAPPTISTIGPLTGLGSISLGGNILKVNSGSTSTTFSGSMTDGGSGGGLTKAGSATLTLSGANLFTGTTTINAGTLQAGATNAFSSSSEVAMQAGATLDLNGYNNAIFTLSGTGGTVDFNNNHLLENTLTIGGAASLSPYNGIIQGTGKLVLNGSGTLTLGGANTYSGTTTINSGTLQAGIDDAFSPSSDIVVNGGTLDLNSHPNTIPSLSGSGDVLLGAATGILTISGTGFTTYSGQMSQSGGLTQQGSGTTTLTGNNTYSGPTEINGGTLVVGVNSAGLLTSSNVSVNSGGTLKGTGTISQTVTVKSGGTIIGGNSIGTIHLGALTLEGGANLALEINNTGQSTIYEVTNAASLGGNLAITVDRGVYQAGTTYTFITSSTNGVSGTFSTYTTDAPGTRGFSGYLNIQPGFAALILTAPIYPVIPTNGLSGNAKAVADYLNRFDSDPAVQPVLLAVGAFPPDEAQASLNSISPARNAISTWTAQNTLLGINLAAANRMLQQRYMRGMESSQPSFASIRDIEEQLVASRKFAQINTAQPYGKTQTAADKKSRFALWAEGIGLFGHQNAIEDNPAYHSSTGCGLVGADFYNFKQGQIGAALGYAQSSIEGSGTGSGTIQSYLAGLYGTLYLQNAYMELGLWGAYNQFHNKRNVAYPGFNAVAKSDHNGWQLIPHIGSGYDFNFFWGTIEPFVSFDAAVLAQNDYSEHGAGILDMHLKSSTSWLLRTEAGVNAYQVKKCAPGYLIFRETLSYVNLAPFSAGTFSGTGLVGFPPGFTVTSFTHVQNMISPGFEVFFKCMDNGFFVSLAYDGEFTLGPGRYMLNEGTGKIGWFF